MVTGLDEFTKEHEYLICVDSDGCAMDTMNCKHLQCFGPCMVAEFGLDARRAEWLARWNEINLYSMTRGFIAKERTIAIRCFCPPESCAG